MLSPLISIAIYVVAQRKHLTGFSMYRCRFCFLFGSNVNEALNVLTANM